MEWRHGTWQCAHCRRLVNVLYMPLERINLLHDAPARCAQIGASEAAATLPFADVEDFVKNQMGKSTGSAKDWRSVGDEVLKHLRDLRERSRAAAADPGQQLQFRLRLARNWVRSVVSQYLYRIARDQMEGPP